MEDWFCEASLWTHWTYQGHMAALRRSHVMLLESVKFHSVARASFCPSIDAAKYAELFVEYLNQVEHDELTDLQLEGFDMTGAVLACCDNERSPREIRERNEQEHP